MATEFVVEQAGCASCAALIKEVLGELGTVEHVVVDEKADVATVRLSPFADDLSFEEVERALTAASVGSGHAYRVQPGSIALS